MFSRHTRYSDVEILCDLSADFRFYGIVRVFMIDFASRSSSFRLGSTVTRRNIAYPMPISISNWASISRISANRWMSTSHRVVICVVLSLCLLVDRFCLLYFALFEWICGWEWWLSDRVECCGGETRLSMGVWRLVVINDANVRRSWRFEWRQSMVGRARVDIDVVRLSRGAAVISMSDRSDIKYSVSEQCCSWITLCISCRES